MKKWDGQKVRSIFFHHWENNMDFPNNLIFQERTRVCHLFAPQGNINNDDLYQW